MIECSDKRHIVGYHDSRDTPEYLIFPQVSKNYPLARQSSGMHNYGTALFTFSHTADRYWKSSSIDTSIVFTFGFLELECEYQNDLLSQTRNSEKDKHTQQLN
jgi:hypothetical protein